MVVVMSNNRCLLLFFSNIYETFVQDPRFYERVHNDCSVIFPFNCFISELFVMSLFAFRLYTYISSFTSRNEVEILVKCAIMYNNVKCGYFVR